MNEPTLYFITKDNHVKRIDSTVKDITYKDVHADDYEISLADDYEISLNGEKYKIDRETWEYINWWTTWH
ncbi:hypothetical protein [Ligilactobacillus aviarius]|uniref:hypothetical protein n=1 Tax=Ligilactobacillus aviarius TaxID=1606 RepID=UPI0024BB5B4B|nr:hypothetical protein [Ligilactobacillus aviarius]